MLRYSCCSSRFLRVASAAVVASSLSSLAPCRTVQVHCIAAATVTRRHSSSSASSASGAASSSQIERKAFDDGRVFEGTFDAATGAPLPGTKLTDAGDVYVGEYNAAWQKHGKGRAVLQDGTVYEGRFEDDALVEGRVKMADENGDAVHFEGTLTKEGGEFRHGTLSHSEYTYTGPFDKNEPHGAGGVLRFATGAVQEGSFFRGQLHGDKCKWRLDSGLGVYVGHFVHGAITSGELRTPTFTYEGEFNEKGQAHGVGRQEHHATSPKLIFRGHWQHGSLVTGQCETEDGVPVDWHNDAAAQEQLVPRPELMRQKYMHEKLGEQKERLRDARTKMAEDTVTRFEQSGRFDDAIGLGYEAGPLTASRMVEKKQRSDAERMQGRGRENLAQAVADLDEQERALKAALDERATRKQQQQQQQEQGSSASSGAAPAASSSPPPRQEATTTAESKSAAKSSTATTTVVPDISNWELARAALMKQKGKQLTTADTLHDQFERFKLSREKKAPAAAAAAASAKSATAKTAEDDGDDGFVVDPAPSDTLSAKPAALRVDGNEPFVEFTAKTYR